MKKLPEENELKAGQDLSSADLLSADERLRLEILKIAGVSREVIYDADQMYRWVKGLPPLAMTEAERDRLFKIIKDSRFGGSGVCRKKIETSFAENEVTEPWLLDLFFG